MQAPQAQDVHADELPNTRAFHPARTPNPQVLGLSGTDCGHRRCTAVQDARRKLALLDRSLAVEPSATVLSMTSSTEADPPPRKRKANLSQTDVPTVSLQEAMRIPKALLDYGMAPSTPVDVGVAIGIAPTSGGFRALAGASIAYGLTTGSYNAAEIALTDLGKRVVAPTEEGDDILAMREAFERPRVIKEFVARYQGNKLPSNTQVIHNVLVSMGVPMESAERAYSLIRDGLATLGYLKEVNSAEFVQRPAGSSGAAAPSSTLPPTTSPADVVLDDGDGGSDIDLGGGASEPSTSAEEARRPNGIFLGHGRNKAPLEQLMKILNEYGIAHKEAVEEPNAGRPIPTKVAQVMKECGAAILIFTADEQLFDAEQNEIWRPSENVIHELGAASVLYDNRIIIFKEKGVTLASNFSSIGYIEFEKDRLSEKGIDLFRELVSFKIVSITVA